MTISKQQLSKLLFAFSDALESMEDHEFDLLLEGKAKLRIASAAAPKKSKSQASVVSEETLKDLVSLLNQAESREAAENILSSVSFPRKRDLLKELAKRCNVVVGSKDSISMIEERIIENVVGAKLTSKAFRKLIL